MSARIYRSWPFTTASPWGAAVSARIYTADEARELRRVAQGPFESSLCDSVEHHAARADAAEQRAGEWAHRAGESEAHAVVAEAECNALRARIVELTAALRDYAPRCGECAERALWYFADWRVKREYAACDAHRSTLPEGHDDVPHAATLRSLDAPALVVDDAACAAIDGAASIGPQGVDATEREVLP